MNFASLCCQIKDVVLNVTSWNPARDGYDQIIRYIDLSSVNQDTKTIHLNEPVVARESPSRARQLVQTGDVLVSTVRPNLNGIAIIDASLDGATASTGFCVLRPDEEKLDRAYLFHWVKTSEFILDMVRKATGASYPAVSDRIVLESKIPLPPIAEQKRIAAILDKAEELRGLRRKALGELDAIVQSIFLEMFGDPVTNSKKWKTGLLRTICDEINDCPHSTPVWTENGVICLRTSNLTRGSWNWNDTRFVSVETYHERSKRGYIKAGDIILSREGTVGVAAIATSEMKICMGQRLVQVRPLASVLTSEFTLQHLLYVLAPARISMLMVGSTSQHLNVKELKDLKIPLPPFSLQREFARRVQTIERLKTIHRESLAQLDALFTSLQHRAFRGEL